MRFRTTPAYASTCSKVDVAMSRPMRAIWKASAGRGTPSADRIASQASRGLSAATACVTRDPASRNPDTVATSTAAIMALEALKRPCEVVVHTDSEYVRNGMERWIKGWVRNNWRNAAKEPVKNFELWQRLLAAAKPHQVEWRWVRGHNGDVMNERADVLATRAREEAGG